MSMEAGCDTIRVGRVRAKAGDFLLHPDGRILQIMRLVREDDYLPIAEVEGISLFQSRLSRWAVAEEDMRNGDWRLLGRDVRS